MRFAGDSIRRTFRSSRPRCAIGLASSRGPIGTLRIAAGSFIAGLTVFSGSLYGLALGGPRWIGVLTPLGGLAMMAGWLALALGFSGRRSAA
jgi:uncharacterized membrane protein YgdD (TMEM256/DUF423 family)